MTELLGFDRRRRLEARLLGYGSLGLAAAISLSFAALEITRIVPPLDWFAVPLVGNAVLAVAGCGYGAVRGLGRPGRRLVTSLAAGAAGALGYAGLFFVGLIAFVTAYNAVGGNS